MLDLTGGDAAALAEVRTALDLIAAQDDPDLASALRLACHRDHLADRNTNIPASLPAVWAALGQPTRAEALATSITDPDRQAQALAQVAGALAKAGQHQQAEDRRPAPSPTRAAQARGPGPGGGGAGQGRAAPAGRHAAGRLVARSITDPGRQAQALAQVAGALAEAGQHQQAEAVARSITDPGCQA